MAKKRSKNGSGVKQAQDAMDAVNRSVAENSALLSADDQGKLAGETANNTTRREGRMDIVFKHKSTQKNGINTYSAEGYGGSVYLNKSLFAGPPPAEITVSAPDGTFQVGTARGGSKDVSPERLAKQQEKLAKQLERQQKAADKLRKQQELVERLKAAQNQPA